MLVSLFLFSLSALSWVTYPVGEFQENRGRMPLFHHLFAWEQMGSFISEKCKLQRNEPEHVCPISLMSLLVPNLVCENKMPINPTYHRVWRQRSWIICLWNHFGLVRQKLNFRATYIRWTLINTLGLKLKSQNDYRVTWRVVTIL